jgi:hypothetical protein
LAFELPWYLTTIAAWIASRCVDVVLMLVDVVLMLVDVG